jgi:hypothetical protein
MADISMCTGKGCPAKEFCYRHEAPKNPYRQSYFTNPPLTGYVAERKPNGNIIVHCNEFWEMENKELPKNIKITKDVKN